MSCMSDSTIRPENLPESFPLPEAKSRKCIYQKCTVSNLSNVARQCTRYNLPRSVSLTIPTETRAALALARKSWIVSGFSDEHPGGTTGRESWKETKDYLISAYFELIESTLIKATYLSITVDLTKIKIFLSYIYIYIMLHIGTISFRYS